MNKNGNKKRSTSQMIPQFQRKEGKLCDGKSGKVFTEGITSEAETDE